MNIIKIYFFKYLTKYLKLFLIIKKFISLFHFEFF